MCVHKPQPITACTIVNMCACVCVRTRHWKHDEKTCFRLCSDMLYSYCKKTLTTCTYNGSSVKKNVNFDIHALDKHIIANKFKRYLAVPK